MSIARLNRVRRDDRGSVVALVAVMLAGSVLVPMLALVVDIGKVYVEREQLQTGADSAALAVARACAATACAKPTDVPAQWRTARDYANINAKDGHTDVTEVCGNWGALPACSAPPAGLRACIGAPPSDNYVEVRVRTEMPDGSTLLPPTFSRTLAGNAGYQGTSVATCARATVSSFCVSAAKATYHHTFDGPAGTATMTADQPLCKGERQPFTLVSYTAPDSAFAVPQYLYDYQTDTITSTKPSITYRVDVPPCYTQVDFVVGDTYINPLYAPSYGDRKVGSPRPPGNMSVGPPAWYNGGTRKCTPQPTVSFTANCDGTMDVQLGNGAGANVDAAFTITAGATSQFLRVAQGASRTVKIKATDAVNVGVEDNLFKTGTAKWTKPGGC